MAVRCSQCGSRIVEPAGIDQFECPFCQATTLLVPADGSTAEPKKLERKQAVDLSKFTIDLDGPNLEMWWGWNRLKGAALISLGTVIGWFGSIYARGAFSQSGKFDLIAMVVGVVGIAFAVGIAYTGLAMLLNSTRIAILNRVLRTSHGPLPYYFHKRIPLADLLYLRVHHHVERDSDGEVNADYHQLLAHTRQGRILLINHEESSKVPAAVKSVLDAHINWLSERPADAVPSAQREAAQTKPRRRKVVLICPQCGGLVRPPRKITSSKCRYCSAELTIHDEVWESLGLHPPRRRNIRHKPVTFILGQAGPKLTISARWNSEGSGIVLQAAGVLVGIATLSLLLAFWSDNWSLAELTEGGTGFISLVSLLPLASGTFIGYMALCHLFNRTVVELDPNRIRVWNGPLPMKKTSQLPIEKISQISIHRSRDYFYKSNCYNLEAISDYGGTLQLFFDQPELKGLETLERLIERRLQIADRVVEGAIE